MALSVLRGLCESRIIGTQVSLPCNRAEGTVGLREQPNYIAVEQAQCLIVHLLKCLGSLWMLMVSMNLILIKIVKKKAFITEVTKSLYCLICLNFAF